MRFLVLLSVIVAGCRPGSPTQVSQERAVHQPAWENSAEAMVTQLLFATVAGASGSVDLRAEPPSSSSYVRRLGRVERDYAIRVGIGFGPEDLKALERAVGAWREATGLPLQLRNGYGPMGSFHITESIPVCGQHWVYDGFLGCYNPTTDSVVLNRHGIELVGEEGDDLLYVVLLHELGHWLGLAHAEEGADSIMLSDLPRLGRRALNRDALGLEDLLEVCRTNPCDESVLSARTSALQLVTAASRAVSGGGG